MPEYKTQEEIEKEVYDSYGEEYIVLGEYTGEGTPINVKHIKCGREFDARISTFIKGVGKCPRCTKRGHKNHEDFIYEVNELVGNEYTVMTHYEDRKILVYIRHNECGKVNDFVPMNFINGSRCPKCAIKKKVQAHWERYGKTHEEFVKEFNDLHGEEYDVVGEYVDKETKVTVKHNQCGKEYEVRPKGLVSWKGCQDCKFIKDRDTFIQEVWDLVGEEYTFVEEYTGKSKRMPVRHNKCGRQRKVTPKEFFRDTRCPKCDRDLRIKEAKENPGIVKTGVEKPELVKTPRVTKKDKFKEDASLVVSEEFTILDEYKMSNVRLRVIHDKCGREVRLYPEKILEGVGCDRCGISPLKVKTHAKTHEWFMKELGEDYDGKYEILGKYVDSTTKIKVRNKKTGKETGVLPITLRSYKK